MDQDIYGDEYPILWYESNIDSEEKNPLKTLIQGKKSIHLFSEFEETLKFAESLGISFLLIVSNELEEQKLLKDFEGLKGTFGRRLFDTEEEAVFEDLLRGVSCEERRYFKAYVFYTREDFENEAPVNEDEEDITIMCDVKDMAQQFREDFIVIWCDPEINSESKETLMKELDILEENIYLSFEDLLKRIENSDSLPYHLILSGKTQVELIVDKIHVLKNLVRLYIYNGPPKLDGVKNLQIKVRGTLKELLPKIKKSIRAKSILINTLPAFAADFDNLEKSQINNLHYYLQGFINFSNRKQAKRDFISLAKKIYQNKKLLSFEKEYYEYERKHILEWYTEDSPIYKLINNCLRIATSDSILYCRFLLKDMERAIREEYQQETARFNGLVYRGAFLSKEEYEKLERNVGKEIEMYGFLSTSVNKRTAINFLKADIDKKILITIIVPPFPLPELDHQGFANVTKFSKYPGEAEILFNVRSRFQVLRVENLNMNINYEMKKCRHLVLMYGAQLLRKYMTKEKPLISLEFQRPVSLKCRYCESENNLFAFHEEETHIICKECFIKYSAPKNTFLLPIDKENKSIKKINFLGKILEFDKKFKLVHYYGYKCHECSSQGKKKYYKWINTQDESLIIQCSECFEQSKEDRLAQVLISEESPYSFWESGQSKWEKAYVEFNP